MSDRDPSVRKRVLTAMMDMKKIDVAVINAALDNQRIAKFDL